MRNAAPKDGVAKQSRDAHSITTDRVLPALENVKKTGPEKWEACCPSHDDKNPSLSIREDDGKTLVKCHAGCSQDRVIDALRGLGAWPESGNDDFLPSHWDKAPRSTVWPYRNSKGSIIGYVARYDGRDGKQVIPFFRRAGRGWRAGYPDGPRTLYGLYRLSRQPDVPVVVTEGEKAADAAQGLLPGHVAVTSPGGSKAASQSDWTPLKGRKVLVWPDADDPGHRYAEVVTRELTKAGAQSVEIIDIKALWAVCGQEATGSVDAADWPDNTALPAPLPLQADNLKAVGNTVSVVCLGDIEPQEITWLWPQRLACGKVGLIVGDPGLSKSTLTLDIAARVTTGTAFPDGRECPRGNVVILSAEDDPADTIRPRLDAAFADVNRVFLLKAIREEGNEGGEPCSIERSFNLATDVRRLQELVRDKSACLVIIDPLSAYLAGTDSHNNADVRTTLMPLQRMAQEEGCAIIGVSHLNKASGQSVIYRTMGSLAFTAAARAVYVVARDEDDETRRLFLPLKNNLGNDQDGLAYEVVSADRDVPRLEWSRDPVDKSANEVLAIPADPDARSERAEAADWLRHTLSDGPMAVKDIQKLAGRDGFSWRTIQRAKRMVGAEATKAAFSKGWRWELPEGAQAKDANPTGSQLAPFDESKASHGFQGNEVPQERQPANGGGLGGEYAYAEREAIRRETEFEVEMDHHPIPLPGEVEGEL